PAWRGLSFAGRMDLAAFVFLLFVVVLLVAFVRTLFLALRRPFLPLRLGRWLLVRAGGLLSFSLLRMLLLLLRLGCLLLSGGRRLLRLTLDWLRLTLDWLRLTLDWLRPRPSRPLLVCGWCLRRSS